MIGRFLFLGTSGSMGVPVIGCRCCVCTSNSPFNKRRRCAGVISACEKIILIDAGPEIRQQLLDAGIDHLDGALITHAHYDHMAAIDDLKAFTFAQKKKLPVLLGKHTYEELRFRHHYLMEDSGRGEQGMYFDFHVLEDTCPMSCFSGLCFELLNYSQVGTPVTGFKIGNLAYLSDIKEYSQELIDSISGIDILILSALRYTPSPMHLSVPEAIVLAEQVGAKNTYFTHMSHEIDYTHHSSHLPKNIAFAYDGLEIPFQYDKGIQ
ncbi:MAG: MBL fold metallo-hydrolase [Chlamydiae bacterium]|nr:MBL fold metallo-hydrolase [Chlamydiota bacterium]